MTRETESAAPHDIEQPAKEENSVLTFPHWAALDESTGLLSERYGRISFSVRITETGPYYTFPHLYLDIFAVHRLLQDTGLPVLIHLTNSLERNPAAQDVTVTRKDNIFKVTFYQTQLQKDEHGQRRSGEELAQAYDRALKKGLIEISDRYFKEDEAPIQLEGATISLLASYAIVRLIEAIQALQGIYRFEPERFLGSVYLLHILINFMIVSALVVNRPGEVKKAYTARDNSSENNPHLQDDDEWADALYKERIKPITDLAIIQHLAKITRKLGAKEGMASVHAADPFVGYGPAFSMALLKTVFPVVLSYAARQIDALKLSQLKDSLISHRPPESHE